MKWAPFVSCSGCQDSYRVCSDWLIRGRKYSGKVPSVPATWFFYIALKNEDRIKVLPSSTCRISAISTRCDSEGIGLRKLHGEI